MSLDERRVALGPITGTAWCVLDNAPDSLIAPGGVVLCWEDTDRPHPDAERAATSGWLMLERWHDDWLGR